ncbi:hypothetical protein Vadar_019147 [Vaccinium darrowii]|uniref:Uncharacterized protein n=1 Tax=Vaccinium darrowii TaxID=229202 RepID=A0ACB7XIW8_9ERIC|nr:hypothetical protein Vadar_019147 [Vaccinium darrowii]
MAICILLLRGHGMQATEFRVFEMESDYSGNWFVTYHANLGGIVDAFGFPLFAAGVDYPISIIAVVREENEDESALLLNAPGAIVSYNFKDGTLKGLLDLAPRNIGDALKLFTQSNTYRYIETFVPV